MSYLYHLCARNFRGTTLYPLNGLASIYPDIYEQEKTKYVGREAVMSCVVPQLGVTWSDTVNLSALNPRLLVAERRRLGVPYSKLLTRRLLCIPVSRIAALPAVQYRSASHWINSSPGDSTVPLTPPEAEFSIFDASCYQELSEVPRLHTEYLERQMTRGEAALSFVFIPHVLVASSIDLTGLETVELETLLP